MPKLRQRDLCYSITNHYRFYDLSKLICTYILTSNEIFNQYDFQNKNHPRLDSGAACQNSGPDEGEFPMLRISIKGPKLCRGTRHYFDWKFLALGRAGGSIVLTWLFGSFCAKTKGIKIKTRACFIFKIVMLRYHSMLKIGVFSGK